MSELKNTIELARAVLESNDRIIRKCYHGYKQRAMPRLRKRFPNIQHEDLESAFHDALLEVISKYIKRPSVSLVEGQVKGLLLDNATAMIYVIATRVIFKKLRGKKNKYIAFEDYLGPIPDEPDQNAVEKENEYKTVLQAFFKLRLLCRDIISGKLLHGLSFKEIDRLLSEEEGKPVAVEIDEKKRSNKRRQENFRCLKKFVHYYKELTNPHTINP